MKPSIGRIVHYRLPDGRSAGDLRPAIVVTVWPEDGTPHGGSLQLQVFTDGTNDGPSYASGIAWKTSVVEGTDLGTWRWPERQP